MHAHVTTYRLGSGPETEDDIRSAFDNADTIMDQTARTIASWYHAPRGCPNITALSHGLPFDTAGLREEAARDVSDFAHREALLDWIESLEALLSE